MVYNLFTNNKLELPVKRFSCLEVIFTPGIQKHVTMRNTRNRAKVHIGIIKDELYLFSNNNSVAIYQQQMFISI